ncbi:aldo/keto reductase [Corallincola platygyrae]|uniref:Aldo/keto reductase n=1 Tax=Corallincola platygyrae TaxID=1193278 RepID=A0ABW4XPJ1_9GAMM
MKLKKLNRFELPFSALGYGCWGISGGHSWSMSDDQQSIATIHTAIEGGVNFFDVAPVYGLGHAESVLGQALKGKQRESLIIASKCGLVWNDANEVSNNLSTDSLMAEIDQSLARLGVEYLDLYQIHWPNSEYPLEEILQALEAIKASGKVRHLGVSNFSLAMLTEACELSAIDSFQGLYNMLERNPESYHGIGLDYRSEAEILPYCQQHGLAFFPYSPLMQGLLGGQFDASQLHENDVRMNNPKLRGEQLKKYLEIVATLQQFAAELGKPLSELAINWLADQDAVTSVIAGAATPEQVQANLKAMAWELSAADRQALELRLQPYKAEGLL